MTIGPTKRQRVGDDATSGRGVLDGVDVDENDGAGAEMANGVRVARLGGDGLLARGHDNNGACPNGREGRRRLGGGGLLIRDGGASVQRRHDDAERNPSDHGRAEVRDGRPKVVPMGGNVGRGLLHRLGLGGGWGRLGEVDRGGRLGGAGGRVQGAGFGGLHGGECRDGTYNDRQL